MPKRAEGLHDQQEDGHAAFPASDDGNMANGNAVAGPSRHGTGAHVDDGGGGGGVNVDGDELEWYKSHLDSHILASRLGYQGESPTAYSGDYFGRYPSLIGPKKSEAVWSPEDKALFFASLSRYSRFRPDLIALACGKTEVAVNWYLDLLERGDHRLRNWDSSRHGARDRYDTWRKSRRSRIGLAPSAREVGTDWIKEEERLAGALIRQLGEEEGELRREEVLIERKREKRAVMKTEMEQIGVKRKRDFLRGKHIEQELQDKWEAEDWGMELDDSKLRKVQAVLRDVGPVNGEQHSERDMQAVKKETASGVTRTEDKIQHDAIRLARLEEMPKKHRSSLEKAELRELKNRTRMRHTKRRAKLRDKGYTDEDIDTQGVDQLYAQVFEGFGTQRVEDKVPLALTGVVADMRLDLLNLDHIRQAQELISPLPPHLSLEILEELVLELRTFLTCLIYQVIILAEGDEGQPASTESDARDSDTSSSGNRDSAGITSVHVSRILALRGAHPKDTIQDFLSRLGTLPTSEPVGFPPALEPPAEIPWTGMANSNPSPPVSSKSSTVDEESMPSDEGDEDDNLTDQEDTRLDEALEELDNACDANLAEQLKRNEKEGMEEWWDDPWKEGNVVGEPLTSFASDMETDVDVDGQEVDELRESRGDDFQRARRTYTKLLFSITRARRDRSSRAFQREKYAHLRSRNRTEFNKARDWIVSDDSMDDHHDDEGQSGREESESTGSEEDGNERDVKPGRHPRRRKGAKRKNEEDDGGGMESEGDDEDAEEEEEGRRSDGWGPGSSADPSSGSERDEPFEAEEQAEDEEEVRPKRRRR